MTGRKLGNYEITEKLGEGGMGEVWRARDARLNRSVAIKILPSDVAGDASRRQRFEQEAQALGALNHPNIVAVYDVGQTDGQAYIVSELVDGESLRKVIERGGLSNRKIIDYAVQAAEGIAAAHALGIIHRDLKPENIMVSRDGRVKVLDFGLAKQSAPKGGDETATLAMSTPGMVLGTVGYMSPEQVRGETVDARSDIFSFGCVLYELASGRRAFEGKSAADVMSAILREDPPELSAANATLPAGISGLVSRCLEKDPSRRFQSAADLAFALRSISSLSTSQSQAHAAQKKPRRNRLMSAVALAGAAALFAGGYWLARRAGTTALPQFQRLTFNDGRIANARFTLDGQSVIYSAAWDGGPSRLYLTTPGTPESRDLDVPPNSRLLAVSSKGDLALLTGPFSPDGDGTLERGSVGGGKSRGLLENVLYADWSPDGSEMAVVRNINGTRRLEYPIGKKLVESPWLRAGIRISPDGQQVAFAGFDNGSSIRIDTVDRSGKLHRLGVVSGQLRDPDASQLAWTRDGSEILFQAFDENERNSILAINMSGKKRAMARFPARVSLYDAAADGRLLLSTDNSRLGVRAQAADETAERDLSVLESAELRNLTPDGRIILLNIAGESGGVKGSIYWRLLDGSPAVRLGDGYAFDISPDGKWVTGFTARNAVTRKFVLMPTGPGEEIPISVPQLPQQMGVVMGWLAGPENYLVEGASARGKWQLFAWNRNANTIKPVTPDTIVDDRPLIAPDGKRVAYQDVEKGWSVCTVGDAIDCRAVPGLSVHDSPVGFTADGRGLYATMHHDENRMMMVSIIDTTTGDRKLWKHIQPTAPVDELSNLRITPDGRAYAYNYSRTRADLYVASGVK